MVKEDKRKVVQALSREGKKKKEIARLLNLDPQTVRRILTAGPENPGAKQRSDKKGIDAELLRSLYSRCNGYMQRVHELLGEEEKIKIGYSTLTRMIRSLGIGQKINKRCHHVDDIPGNEMQHDTSPYRLKIGNETRVVVCSGLYLRYSKMRYVKFYPHFNRFLMKCFFYEVLTYWKYAARTCMIDNTNLAVLHGTGKEAVFHPEMTAFAKPYGFDWVAHEKGHANRKAGKERNFYTIETNFFPGRSFESMEDLNRQAFDWAVSRYARRPQSKTRLIPIALFEEEKPDLVKLPAYVEPPYRQHQRSIDRYGYLAFNANYYWVPGKSTGEVSAIEYPGRIKIFAPNQAPVEYPLPAWGLKNQKFKPQGACTNPYGPKNIKKPSHEEERRLRASGARCLQSEICCAYLDFIKSGESGVKQRQRFIRQLYALSKRIAPALFAATIKRALIYRIANIETLIRISRQLMKKELYELPEITHSNDYEQRQAYQQGRFSQETGLEFYQNLFEDPEDAGKDNKEQPL